MSRIAVLWFFTNPYSYKHWSLYQLLLAWSFAEIPRYAFYLWNVLFPNTSHPYILFYLRYTLFLVLYPCGISAEIIQGWVSISYWNSIHIFCKYIVYSLLSLYIPGSPYLYMHMLKNRHSQFHKRIESERMRKKNF